MKVDLRWQGCESQGDEGTRHRGEPSVWCTTRLRLLGLKCSHQSRHPAVMCHNRWELGDGNSISPKFTSVNPACWRGGRRHIVVGRRLPLQICSHTQRPEGPAGLGCAGRSAPSQNQPIPFRSISALRWSGTDIDERCVRRDRDAGCPYEVGEE